jgi:hypothetical protein
MQTNQTDVQIARLEIKVAHLEVQLTRMSGQLDDVLSALTEARGGWRTLMWLGGAASVVGAAVSYVINHVAFK